MEERKIFNLYKVEFFHAVSNFKIKGELFLKTTSFNLAHEVACEMLPCDGDEIKSIKLEAVNFEGNLDA